jgi:hypothetical protein
MGFSSQQYKKGNKERPWKVHPVWRGIGCVMLLLVPIMSWFVAQLYLESQLSTSLPYDLTRVVVIPLTHVRNLDRYILQANYYFRDVHFVIGQVFLTVIFSVIGFGILALIYAIIYRVAGPPRYGPFDIPSNKIR